MKVTPKENISIFLKREIRKSVGASLNIKVILIAGNQPPKLVGRKGHYENKSGDIIRYPNAYRKAWGKPIYVHSTIRIEVGGDWILSNFSLYNLRMHKLRAFK